jgi:hypothetical protein
MREDAIALESIEGSNPTPSPNPGPAKSAMAPTRDNGGIPMNETPTIEAPTTKTTDSISEAASKKRGRPRLMDAEQEAFLRNLFGSEVRTQRGLHNVFYR